MTEDVKDALRLHSRAKILDAQQGKWFSEVGKLCCEMEDRRLWELLGEPGDRFYKCFSDWLSDALPKSQASAREAKTVWRRLSPHVPEETLKTASRCNLAQAAKCSDSVLRDPEMMDLLSGSEEAFIRKANQKHNQHLSPKVWGRLSYNEEGKKETCEQAAELVRIIEAEPDLSFSEAVYRALYIFVEEKQHIADSMVGSVMEGTCIRTQ